VIKPTSPPWSSKDIDRNWIVTGRLVGEAKNILRWVGDNARPQFDLIIATTPKFLDALNAVHKECKGYSTVDVYAKYLHLKQQYKKFSQINLLIALGLLFLQNGNRVDQRYDNFWASLLEKNVIPPGNVKVLSCLKDVVGYFFFSLLYN
jgi:hypothetical protein